MLGLTATATANSAARQAEAGALLGADPTGALVRFRAFADGSVFSSNVAADKIVEWDAVGKVLDTRSWHIARAGGDAAAGLAAFTGDQGSWLARRQGFEDLWEHGRRFVYGAVNAGGMGTEGTYGPFCVVITDPEAHGPLALAVFPGDSAQRYTTESGTVDASAARGEATAWAHRGDLAVLHRSSDVHGGSATPWFEVVCRPGRYLEVVLAADLPTAALAEVRVRKDLADRLRSLRSRRFLGDVLAPVENNEVRAYQSMRRWRRAHGTVIQQVT